MGLRFNPPPGWPPAPPGFVPPPGWQPDPSWPPAPEGWQFWVPDDTIPATEPTLPGSAAGPGAAAGPESPAGPGFPAGPGAAAGLGSFAPPGAGGPAQAPPAPPGQPGYPYPGSAYPGYPYQGRPQYAETNGLAIASLVLGLLGFILPCGVVGIVLGIIALVQVRDRQQKGKGLAIAGLVLAGLWLALYVGLFVTAAVVGSGSTGSLPFLGIVVLSR